MGSSHHKNRELGKGKRSKRHLLLGRKVITNLDSILKRRDITLPTKVCLVKAVVFPVCTNVRVGPLRELSMEKLMLLNCVGEDS